MAPFKTLCAILIVFYLQNPSLVEGKKIGLLAWYMSSHMGEMDGVGVELLNRGHEVVFIGAYQQRKFIKDKRYKTLFYDYPFINDGIKSSKDTEKYLNLARAGIADIITDPILAKICDVTCANKEFMEKIRAEKFDVFVLDALPIFKCFFLVAHYSGAPYVGVGTHLMASNLRSNFMDQQSLNDGTWTSSFGTRMKSALISLGFEYHHYHTLNYAAYGKAINYEFPNVDEIADKTKMWLLNQSPLLEQPTFLPPHLRLVGGLSLKKPKALDEEWKKWADSASNGFIVISFGSLIQFQPKWMAEKLAGVVAAMPKIQFAVRIDGDEAKMYPTNAKTTPWLPQSSLMLHPNCKVFLTHCGNNGQQEALLGGVPMIGIPLFGDQPHNAARIVERGYGLRLNLWSMTSEQLLEAVQKVLPENSSYRQAIKKSSQVFQKRGEPRVRAAEAVEQVMSGEADLYYPTDRYRLNVFQYHSVDVLMILVVLLLLIFTVPILVICYCCCRAKKSGTVKQKSS